EDARTLRGAHIRKYPAPSGALFVRPVTDLWTPRATLRAHFSPAPPLPPNPGGPDAGTGVRTAALSSNDRCGAGVPGHHFDSTGPARAQPAIQRLTYEHSIQCHISDVAGDQMRGKAGSSCEEIHELSRGAPGTPRPRA